MPGHISSLNEKKSIGFLKPLKPWNIETFFFYEN